jgi:hypothetical protein
MAEDEKILECARALVKAINNSGRSVLRPDIAANFGALEIWLQNGDIEIAYGIKDTRCEIRGPITDVK